MSEGVTIGSLPDDVLLEIVYQVYMPTTDTHSSYLAFKWVQLTHIISPVTPLF
jgi:hypothetical protein